MKTRKIVVSIVAVIALISILSICLVACNADSYVSKLEKAEYVVTKTEFDQEQQDALGLEWSVTGVKFVLGGDKAMVTINKYVNEEDAKEAEETLGEDNITRIGKIVIFGTEQGVKDAK